MASSLINLQITHFQKMETFNKLNCLLKANLQPNLKYNSNSKNIKLKIIFMYHKGLKFLDQLPI